MRTTHVCTLSLALIAAVAMAGCAKKAEQATSGSSSDSLVASNPTERPEGNITPQTTYQEPPKTQAPPPTQAPRPRTPKTTPPRHAVTPPPAEAPAIVMAAGTPMKPSV